jgi:putative RNA 2'-phosphotransferase
MVSLPSPPLEISENRVRARNTQQIPKRVSPENLPKLLFTCARPKALHTIVEKGILPMGRKHVILASDKKLAKRIGKRIHASPSLLTVSVQNAIQQGTLFLQAGENLFLARSIPVGCFTAPPLPKDPRIPKFKKPAKSTERDRSPGSFFPDLTEPADIMEPKKMTRKQRREKDIDWKKSRKKMRRR